MRILIPVYRLQFLLFLFFGSVQRKVKVKSVHIHGHKARDIIYVDLRSDIHKVVHIDFKGKVHFQFSMFYAVNIIQFLRVEIKPVKYYVIQKISFEHSQRKKLSDLRKLSVGMAKVSPVRMRN